MRRRRPRWSRRSSGCWPGSSPSTGSTRQGPRSSPVAPPQKFKSGAEVSFPVVAGHRDANYTECPGSRLYALLPAIRTNVARRVGTAVVASLSADTPLISPNGDGVLDKAQLGVKITAAADWRITLRASGGSALGSWSGQGASAIVTWDGTTGDKLVADGVYTLELTATSAAGETAGATRTDHRRHDRAPPRAGRRGAAHVQPQRRRPGGDRRRVVQPGRGLHRPRRHPRRRRRRAALAARLARSRDRLVHGDVGRQGHRRRRPHRCARRRRTASTSSAATRPATSPGRGSRSPSTGPSASPPPSP